MNHGALIFFGIFVALVSSWYGMVVMPQVQLRDQQPVALDAPGARYPVAPGGLVRRGEEIYRANGCFYCHSQQLRHLGYGGDLERGWGVRHTVSQDYLYDDPVMLGRLRMGQDLRNVGARLPDANWHLLHLYDPQITSPRSIMPPYRFLFEKRPVAGQPSPQALALPPGYQVEAGYEVVPTSDAHALVAYLLNLRADQPLFEAPMPRDETEDDAAPGSAQGAAQAGTPPSTQ
jgi:cytochrome c oxidase cbb3-type subunit II